MIQTTVVGSYPVPAWLRVYNTRESLRDAMLVVLKTQELAGIDVVADGELYRWDINHPETNGMIDYFVRPLQGVEVELTFDQLRAWKQRTGMSYRSRPAAIVTGPLGHGRLNLARDYELYRDLTLRPKKFTVTSPYMLAKVLADVHYGSLDTLVMALAELLKAQLAEIDADVVQIDEANVTGYLDDGPSCRGRLQKHCTAQKKNGGPGQLQPLGSASALGRAGRQCLHVVRGQRFAAKPPVATLDFVDNDPGYLAHVFALDRYHRVGELADHLLLLTGVKTPSIKRTFTIGMGLLQS
jgi:hypothetical protein